MSWWRVLAPYESYVGVGVLAAALTALYINSDFLIHDYYHGMFEEPATKPKTQYITQETEDALGLDTLTSLLEHYNFSIRETAAKIVCDRAVNDDATLRRLLWGVARPDYEERMASLRALAMLTDQTTLERLHTAEGVAAFVRSLQHCIDGSEDEERRLGGGTATDSDTETRRAIRAAGDSMIADVTYDEYHMRDMAEKLCLMFVAQMADRFGVERLVRAGFVEKWLARQRWVDSSDAATARLTAAELAVQRRANFARYLEYRNNRIAQLCHQLKAAPSGRAALEKAGLLEPQQRERSSKSASKKRQQKKQQQQQLQSRTQSDSTTTTTTATTQDEDGERDFAPANPSPLRAELRVVNGNVVSDTGETSAAGDDSGVHQQVAATADGIPGAQDGAGTTTAAASPAQTASRRPTSQNTLEEQRIRRQHREAMVLNDGTRPLRRDDIIERESD